MSVYKEAWYILEVLRKQEVQRSRGFLGWVVPMVKGGHNWKMVNQLVSMYKEEDQRVQTIEDGCPMVTTWFDIADEADGRWYKVTLIYTGQPFTNRGVDFDGFLTVDVSYAVNTAEPLRTPAPKVPSDFGVPCMACSRVGYAECDNGLCQI